MSGTVNLHAGRARGHTARHKVRCYDVNMNYLVQPAGEAP